MSFKTWQLENEALENAFARRLLVEYNIKEVTTQRQAKNGTREFEFPVNSTSPKTRYFNYKSNKKLRIAVFKSGYIRNQNGCGNPYQINKTYKQEHRFTFLGENGLYDTKSIQIARQKVYTQIARLNYMLEYYLNNYCGYKNNRCEYSGLRSTQSYTN